MSLKNPMLRNLSTNWLGLAVNILVSFFLAPFVVKHLGSVYYGIWAVTMQFTGYLYLLDFGVRESVIRYTAKYCARGRSRLLNEIITVSILIYVPIIIVCVGAAAICAWQAPVWFNIDAEHVTEARWAIFLVGMTIAQTFFFNVFTGIQQGLNRFDIMNLVGMSGALVRAAAIVYALSRGYGIVALALIQFAIGFLTGAIGAGVAMHLLRKASAAFRFIVPRWRRMVALARRIFGYGFFVLLNNVAQKITFSSDAIVIAIFMPIRFVTFYAIAGSLIEYLRSLVINTAQIFSPTSSKLHALREHESLARMLISGARLTVVITTPVAICYAILGDEFINLWMGREYGAISGQVLAILGVLQIVSAPHYVISSVLYGMSQHRPLALLRLGEAAANIVLSVILVKSHGLVGVALGTVISHVMVAGVILPRLLDARLGLSPFDWYVGVFGRTLLAAVPMAIAAVGVRHFLPSGNLLAFFAKVGVLCVIYGACVYRVVLEQEQREALVLRARQMLRA